MKAKLKILLSSTILVLQFIFVTTKTLSASRRFAL
jgi:hypothetical protein